MLYKFSSNDNRLSKTTLNGLTDSFLKQEIFQYLIH